MRTLRILMRPLFNLLYRQGTEKMRGYVDKLFVTLRHLKTILPTNWSAVNEGPIYSKVTYICIQKGWTNNQSLGLWSCPKKWKGVSSNHNKHESRLLIMTERRWVCFIWQTSLNVWLVCSVKQIKPKIPNLRRFYYLWDKTLNLNRP